MNHKKLKFAAMSVLMGFSLTSNAMFFIDNEGLETEKHSLNPNHEGYSVLMDKRISFVHHVGSFKETKPTASKGIALTMQDAMEIITPSGWVTFVDERLVLDKKVSWDIDGEQWYGALAQVGATYGYRFILDWPQKVIQVIEDQYYKPVDFNTPVEMTEPKTGKRIFVYTPLGDSKKGLLITKDGVKEVKISE